MAYFYLGGQTTCSTRSTRIWRKESAATGCLVGQQPWSLWSSWMTTDSSGMRDTFAIAVLGRSLAD
jgi:hypothetical protein